MFNRSGVISAAVFGLGIVVAACGADVASSSLAPPSVASFDVTVDPCNPDVTKPIISSVSASPSSLWAPNHKMVPVTITTVASDNCGGVPVCSIASASSNEPDNGLGDGNTTGDVVITGANTLLLRAERAGVGSGRVYTIGVTCTDASGNQSLVSYTTVTVPHDQGKRS